MENGIKRKNRFLNLGKIIDWEKGQEVLDLTGKKIHRMKIKNDVITGWIHLPIRKKLLYMFENGLKFFKYENSFYDVSEYINNYRHELNLRLSLSGYNIPRWKFENGTLDFTFRKPKRIISHKNIILFEFHLPSTKKLKEMFESGLKKIKYCYYEKEIGINFLSSKVCIITFDSEKNNFVEYDVVWDWGAATRILSIIEEENFFI